jgi:hypothetical protein
LGTRQQGLKFLPPGIAGVTLQFADGFKGGRLGFVHNDLLLAGASASHMHVTVNLQLQSLSGFLIR